MSLIWPCARALVSRAVGATDSAAAAPLSDDGADHSERVAIVGRPEPGLARGRWEAPSWVFWVLVVAALFGGATWVVVWFRRAGQLTTHRRKSPKRPSRTVG